MEMFWRELNDERFFIALQELSGKVKELKVLFSITMQLKLFSKYES